MKGPGLTGHVRPRRPRFGAWIWVRRGEHPRANSENAVLGSSRGRDYVRRGAAGERLLQAAVARIPQSDCAVITAAGQARAAVQRTEGQRAHRTLMTDEAGQVSVRGEIPKPDGAEGASRGQHRPPVNAAECHRINPAHPAEPAKLAQPCRIPDAHPAVIAAADQNRTAGSSAEGQGTHRQVMTDECPHRVPRVRVPQPNLSVLPCGGQ